MGPDGVRASWVQQENARPGTNGWQIAPGAAAGIEGFADQSYAADGDTVRLYISTEAHTFHIDAFRMGFYGGVGAREVWQSPEIAGNVQPDCAVTGLNEHGCRATNWTPSIALALTAAFVPGDYLFKLEGKPRSAELHPAHGLGPEQPRRVRHQERHLHLAGMEPILRL